MPETVINTYFIFGVFHHFQNSFPVGNVELSIQDQFSTVGARNSLLLAGDHIEPKSVQDTNNELPIVS